MTIELSLNTLVSAARIIPATIGLTNFACFTASRLLRPKLPALSETLSSLSSFLPEVGEADDKVAGLFSERISKTDANTDSNLSLLQSPTANGTNIPVQNILPQKEPLIHTPWSKNFENISQNKTLIHDPFNAWLEKFVKITINYKVPLHEKIAVPMNDGTIEHYRIHRKITGGGLVAFALCPDRENSPLSPLIVFRATELDLFAEQAAESIQNDLQPHMGEMGWTANCEKFRNLMNDPAFRNPDQKVKIAGYSLGGVHAQYFIHEHFNNVSHGVFYSNPGIHASIADSFAEKIHKGELQSSLVFQIYRTIGDPLHHFGGKHLGCGVKHPNVNVQLLEIFYPSQTKFDVSLHSRCIFSTHRFDYRVNEYFHPDHLEHLLDVSKRDPISNFFEKFRNTFGAAVSMCIRGITWVGRALSKLLRIKIVRTDNREYTVSFQ